MTTKPVENPPIPGYPDKYADESRKALAAARPQRWLATPVAAGLAATVALGLSGCEFTTAGVPVQTPLETVTGTNSLGEFRPIPAGSFIPLFEYGEGTGSFGCVSIAAPYFMSEDEAFALLSVAFAEAGLTLSANEKTTKNAALPITYIDTWPYVEPTYPFSHPDVDTSQTQMGALTPDGLAHSMPVEFVSRDDVNAWQWQPALGEMASGSSVGTYGIKSAAQILAENNPGLVVFYDPVAALDYEALMGIERKPGEGDKAYYARWDAEREKQTQAAKAESQRLLREQVAAFVQWLNAESEHPN